MRLQTAADSTEDQAAALATASNTTVWIRTRISSLLEWPAANDPATGYISHCFFATTSPSASMPSV